MDFQTINPMSSVAVYMQIENMIMFAIASGELKPDDQLPALHVLSKKLDVSVNTVARAYRDLEVMGFIYARRGEGVFIEKGARQMCQEKCRVELLRRLHEVTQEAKAMGMTKRIVNAVVSESCSHDGGPYDKLPASVLKVGRGK